ncbi:hypothetical protein DV495_002347 [Geotrichum candidum]|nr:hypothetical protein DV452_001717 [Geotrichum candidum]KAF5129401.1 hypothetical protein DV495_002347 [Geotrichum candidum]KAF7501034.1 hypothetical protein DV113_001006 [Geotrichum candidum]KAI8134946.1 hypothetical protein DUD61_001398 [Geotrichum candidum]KAI9214633.1 hypothetical protein DS838_000433 [Geotrichum bryndzae]
MTQENQVEQQQKSEFKDEVPKEQSRVERGDTPFTFGQRVLKSDDDIWNHNAWDHAEWDEEQQVEAEAKIEKQKETPVKDFDKSKPQLPNPI